MFACIVTVMIPCFVCRMGSSGSKTETGSQHNGQEVNSNGGMHILEIHAQSVGVSLIIYIFLLLLMVISIYLIRKFCCRVRRNTEADTTTPVAYEMVPMSPGPVQRLKMAEAPRSPAVRLSQPSAPSLPTGTV